MGDHASEAALVEALYGPIERRAERAGRRLHENPAALSPERDGAKLVVCQAGQRRLRDLAACGHPDTDSATAELGVQHSDAAGELSDHDVVVVSDVRRRADRDDSIRLGLAGHVDRVVEVEGAVVQRREDVTVDVDQDGRATSTEHAARCATRSLTLPRARAPLRPRLPTASSAMRSELAASSMRWSAWPDARMTVGSLPSEAVRSTVSTAIWLGSPCGPGSTLRT